ncbi:MAG: hypothetical protein JOY82_12410 [Streptosporangiaceae bacterium]|nr:hypothetical protein [Streptosporangiaceae bacterium]MBV9855298.1 hypothetical protein [Streptosporangiaceae bacterium]
MFSRFTGRPLQMAVAAGAVAVLAAGCGASHSGAAPRPSGSTSAQTAQQAIQLAAKNAQLAKSFSATFSMHVNGPSPLDASGTMRETSTPSLLADANFPTFSAAGHTLPGGMEEILTSSAIYIRMGAFTQMTGKTWIKLPYSEISRATGGLNLSQLVQQAQSSSPLVQTQMLAGATDVRVVGHGVIDGVPVTEYSGSYAMAAAMARLPASFRAKFGQAIERAGIGSADFKVWLDDQHQARKVVVTEDGSTMTETITMVVTSVNQPVTVQLPPASETATIPASALKG